jgi:hypothetical protein
MKKNYFNATQLKSKSFSLMFFYTKGICEFTLTLHWPTPKVVWGSKHLSSNSPKLGTSQTPQNFISISIAREMSHTPELIKFKQ